MNWLLDTDVLSQPAKRSGDSRVIAWMEAERARCYTSAIVIAQLAYWVRSREGRRRSELQIWLTELLAALQGRVYSFNVAVAHVWAEQERARALTGHPMPLADSYIAATASRCGLVVATGNERDFQHAGVRVFNPFREL
ncbi:MAG: type II toxin-antitoxin system VapC family toxin [Acidobacteria bacterium]|nr:MAG: type II toxin-antitoxin system VapC family toxin [Acidobacteriota bacterium]